MSIETNSSELVINCCWGAFYSFTAVGDSTEATLFLLIVIRPLAVVVSMANYLIYKCK